MTADQMPDECRDAFEAHTKTMHGYDEQTLRRKPTGAYFCNFVNAGWIGWQAAWNTRQHPTPAQAQGEIGKALRALDELGIISIGEGTEAQYVYTSRLIETIKAALSHAPEVVTVEEFARGMVIAIAADLTPKEIAESLQKNYPHGLTIIKRTE